MAAAKLAKAEAERTQIEVAKRTLEAAEKSTQKAAGGVDLAETGNAQIREMELLTALKKENVTEARRALTSAEDQLKYTQIHAPFPGIIVKRYRHLGDFASAGVPILSMYNPDLMYVTANLEETRLHGVAPGNAVELEVDAFAEPFRGRVVWIDKSTGAQFALLPRNVVSGEFTKVVQRVPVRIQIEKDDRWPSSVPDSRFGPSSATERATRSGRSAPPPKCRTSKLALTGLRTDRMPSAQFGRRR